MNTKQKIKKTLQKIQSVIDAMLAMEQLHPGSFNIQHRRCGKPACHCALPADKGHILYRITWYDDNSYHTQVLRKHECELAQELVDQNKTWQNHRKKIHALQAKLDLLLKKQRQEIIDLTRGKKLFAANRPESRFKRNSEGGMKKEDVSGLTKK